MGGADAAGDRGALFMLRVGGGLRAVPPSAWRRRPAGDVGGGEVGAGAVQVCGVAPPAGGVAGTLST